VKHHKQLFIIWMLLFWAVAVATAQNDTAIVFTSNRDGNREIYAMQSDGSNPVRLTFNPAEDVEPSWSPDHSQIAFASNREGEFALYLMNADGTNIRRISPEDGSYHNSPSWSPDGRRITYVSNATGGNQVHILDISNLNDTQITQGQQWESIDPVWSPNGRTIAFASNQTGNFEIYLINTDGSNLRRLTNDSTVDSDSPTWSPGGTRLAFAANGGSGEIYLMSADGNGIRVLTSTDQGFVFSPSWSPDEQFLVYAIRTSDTQTSLYRINADGFGSLRLTDGSSESTSPSWASNVATSDFSTSSQDVLYYARVNTEYGATLNLRETPDSEGRILEEFPDGTAITIIDGPVDSGRYRWWQIYSPMGNTGWSVEAADNVRTLQFYDQPLQNDYPYERSIGYRSLFSPGDVVEAQLGARIWSRPDRTYAEERYRAARYETFNIIGLPYPTYNFDGQLTWWYLVRPSSNNDLTGWMLEEE